MAAAMCLCVKPTIDGNDDEHVYLQWGPPIVGSGAQLKSTVNRTFSGLRQYEKLGYSADKLRHTRSVTFSVELDVLNKYQI